MRHPEPGDHVEAHRETGEGPRLVGQGVEEVSIDVMGGNVGDPEAEDQERDRDREGRVAERDGAVEAAAALVELSQATISWWPTDPLGARTSTQPSRA
jgi:hypothetical protein